MRIGINTRNLHKRRDGIGNYIHNLLLNLLMIDQKNEYFVFSPKQEDYLSLGKINDRYNEVISWPFTLKNNSLISQMSKVVWEKLYLPFDLANNRIDLFHDPAFSLPLYCKLPSVITVHDLAFKIENNTHTLKTKLYYDFFFGFALKKANIIIVVSKSTKNDILKLFDIPEDNIFIIYLAVSDSFYLTPSKEDENKIITKYGLTNCPYVLSVSAMNPRKNVPNVIKAFGLLTKKYKELKLVLVGRKAWLCEEIEKTISDLGLNEKIVFTGYVREESLKILYRRAFVFVYPSLYEGFGMPLLEAMASGVPVITSNISSMPEIVDRAGIFVNPCNHIEIAEAMELILSDETLRNKLISLGKERAKIFSWEKTAKQTLAIYESLC